MNLQKPEMLSNALGGLDVISIWKTIQGEGPFVGYPAVFVRLAGCNLQCKGCDTNYTEGRTWMTVDQVVAEVFGKKGEAGLVVFTGGEPLRQVAILDVMKELYSSFEVQIETNGTMCPFRIPDWVTTVCSPKTPNLHLGIIHALLVNGVFKYVIEPGEVDTEDGLPTSILGKPCRVARPLRGYPRKDIFIQPFDSKDETVNRLAMQEAVRVCETFGYRLCLQVQKIVGLL